MTRIRAAKVQGVGGYGGGVKRGIRIVRHVDNSLFNKTRVTITQGRESQEFESRLSVRNSTLTTRKQSQQHCVARTLTGTIYTHSIDSARF